MAEGTLDTSVMLLILLDMSLCLKIVSLWISKKGIWTVQVLFEIQRDQFIWQQFIIEISSQLNLFQELVSCLMFVHGNGMENVVIFIVYQEKNICIVILMISIISPISTRIPKFVNCIKFNLESNIVGLDLLSINKKVCDGRPLRWWQLTVSKK